MDGSGGDAELDRRRRRTRNRMLVVAALVVVVGALLLRLVDSNGIVPVPRETGRQVAPARAALRDAGLVAHVVPVPAAGRPAGTVIGQSPAAGTRVRPGRTVTLRVAAGGGQSGSA